MNLQYRKSGPGDATRLANAIVTIPFAPEFRDLSDNAPLLEEVSKMTHGRVLPLDGDPNDVNLYDSAGVKFPETYLPLARPLMLAWLAIFLLDVAVRRVVVDGRAALRRIKAWLTRTARREEDQTISRLQAQRQKLREQWSARNTQAAVSKHYEGAEKYEGELLTAEPKREPQKPKEEEMKAPESPKKRVEATHIDQLLQAKRKKAGHDEDKGATNE